MAEIPIYTTMCGHHGDILWALPTVRRLSVIHDRPVYLVIPEKYGRRGFAEMICEQPYIKDVVQLSEKGWPIKETAPMTPAEPVWRPSGGYHMHHLGYRQWPTLKLPYEISQNFLNQDVAPVLRPLDMSPWIATPHKRPPGFFWEPTVAVGFSEEHIELKMGLLAALVERFPRVQFEVLVAPNAVRYQEWMGLGSLENLVFHHVGWPSACDCIDNANIFLGCLAGLWVLANAVGKRTVIMEPNPQRQHEIFWVDLPDDDGLNRNFLVKGNDGKPTFDARHVGDALEAALDLERGV